MQNIPNLTKVPFLWDCEVKNRKLRNMLAARTLEVNFELKDSFMGKHPDGTKIRLANALGLTTIQRLPSDRYNTRWVGTIDPAVFMKNLPAWRAFMLICGEHAITIGWDNQHTGCFEGVLFAQAYYACEWGTFDPDLFTRWEVQE